MLRYAANNKDLMEILRQNVEEKERLIDELFNDILGLKDEVSNLKAANKRLADELEKLKRN